MKKFIAVLILLIVVLTGCSQEKSKLQETNDPELQEAVLPVGQHEFDSSVVEQENEEPQMKVSLDSYAALIGMPKQDVLDQLGDQYDIRPMGISKLDQGYYFNEIKTAFFFNGDQRLQYIEHQGEAEFLDKVICGDFSSIKKEYGESEIVTYDILDDRDTNVGMVREYFMGSDNRYEISYCESDYLVSFVSTEETGNDFMTFIYKPVGFLSSKEIVELLDYDTNQIQKRFGMDCILSAPTDEWFPYWDYYKAIGLYFGVNCDHVEESRYIQFAPWIEFDSVQAGLTFEEVKQKLGDSLIIKEERYMMGYVVYSIEYRKEDYFLSMESDDIVGNDSKMQIGKTTQGYRDQIRTDVKWNFYEDKLGFEYQGEEYILNVDSPKEIVPIYDSSVYERFQIPDYALGAGFYFGGWNDRIESFYVAFDRNGDLNLYVRRFSDSSDDSNQHEAYNVKQVLIDYQTETYKKHTIVENENCDEILLENVAKDEKKIMSDINTAIQEHELYPCFILESYDNYDDMMWPTVLEKEIVYDFNQDEKLEVLRIRYIFGTQEESAGSAPSSTVIEIALGNKKVIFPTKPEEYHTFEVGICDVDLSDGLVDIYATEYADCYGESVLFQFNGEAIQEALDLGDDEIEGVSGDGKIYVWNGNFRPPLFEETYEDFVLWFIEYKTGKVISSNQMIGKPYRAGYGDILFRHLGDVPWGAPIQVTMELEGAFYELEFGELLTVIDKDDLYQAIKVRTQDGQEGWIGGYHMVWN